jgi:hypothetical protein
METNVTFSLLEKVGARRQGKAKDEKKKRNTGKKKRVDQK